MPRPLPTEAEARDILARKRTRPAWRPPPPAGQALTGLIKALDARFGQGVGGLEARWPEIVGEPLARVSQPQKLTRGRGSQPGTLEIRVAGPAAAFVQHQSEDILKRVNLFLGEGAVGRLRIAQGPVKPRALPARPAPRRVPTPLDAAADEALAKSVEAAPSPRLKAALMSLGRAVLRD